MNNHKERYLRAQFNIYLFYKYMQICANNYKYISSEYIKINIKSESLPISFMEPMKRRGPKIEHCGTQYSNGLVSDIIPS